MSIDRNVAPQPGPPRPYHFPHVARRTLDNGLRLVVAENHNALAQFFAGLFDQRIELLTRHNKKIFQCLRPIQNCCHRLHL